MLQLDSHFAALEKAVAEACPADCAKLIGELERVKAQAWSRLLAAPASPSRQEPDHAYTIPEVAQILKISVYRAYELARQDSSSRGLSLYSVNSRLAASLKRAGWAVDASPASSGIMAYACFRSCGD